jgi:hypothetical protein
MKLTAAEMDYTRQVAAETGRDPDELIAEGEAVKEDGYRQAYQAAAGTMDRMAGASNSYYSSAMDAEARGEHDMEAGQ